METPEFTIRLKPVLQTGSIEFKICELWPGMEHVIKHFIFIKRFIGSTVFPGPRRKSWDISASAASLAILYLFIYLFINTLSFILIRRVDELMPSKMHACLKSLAIVFTLNNALT